MAGSVLAANFDVTVSPITNKILANETALFKLSVQNNEPTINRYSIYSPDVEWTFVTEPSKDYVLRVYPYSYTETLLSISPYIFTKPGLYGVTVNVKDLSSEELTSKKVLVEIQSATPAMGNYLPSVRLDVAIPKQVDPRQPLKVRVDLINQNLVNISQLELQLSSKLIRKTYKTSLGPLESKSVDFTINLNQYQSPTQDTLKVAATSVMNGETYTSEAAPQNFEVIAYGSLVQTEKSSTRWLRTTRVITLYNEGNTEKEYTVRIKRNIFAGLITSFSPEPRIIEFDDRTYYSWPVILDSRGTAIINIRINYLIPTILLLIVIAAVILYYMLRSPLLLIKSAQVLATRNGGIAELAVQLDIKNRGKKTLRNVHIIDKLPNLIDHHKETRAGVVSPDNVLSHEKKGTILKWGLGSLEPFEERVITYKAISRLSIIGGLSLPACYGNYEVQHGVENATNSNVLYLKVQL
jgi:hypothetical protein